MFFQKRIDERLKECRGKYDKVEFTSNDKNVIFSILHNGINYEISISKKISNKIKKKDNMIIKINNILLKDYIRSDSEILTKLYKESYNHNEFKETGQKIVCKWCLSDDFDDNQKEARNIKNNCNTCCTFENFPKKFNNIKLKWFYLSNYYGDIHQICHIPFCYATSLDISSIIHIIEEYNDYNIKRNNKIVYRILCFLIKFKYKCLYVDIFSYLF